MRDVHIEGMLNAATALVHQGNCNPHEQEIAAEYFGTKAATITTVVHEVDCRLRRLRKMLEADGFTACLVAWPFYTEFDRHIPATMDDAARCLALGFGKKASGIHVVVDPENDTLWLREMEQRVKSAGGGMAKCMTVVSQQVREGKLQPHTAHDLVVAALGSVDDRYQTALVRPIAKQIARA